jgi:sn-glycerol 3-phosphate transport system permease protein
VRVSQRRRVSRAAGGAQPSRRAAVLTYAVLGVLAVVLLFPLYYTVAGSLMAPQEINDYPPALVPTGIYGANYSAALHSVPLGRQYLNSTVVAIAVMLGHLVTATLSAYAFAFLRMPGRRVLFVLFLATMMVPWEAIIIPNYLFMAEHHLVNSYWALALPFLANGFGTFLLRQAFLQFPAELRDAATIDGAGHGYFLTRILLPLSKPALASLAVFAFLSAWNQFFWPLIVTQTPQMQTLQIGINQLRSVDANQPGQVLAGVTLALLPTLLLVAFGQRFLVRGLTAGAIR